ncbi:flagellar hook-associated protein FliD [Peptococcaceae bacterium CEB3]|nr:flagellar hook-associated protein FliD [Peptococcaceae bacterium CEB3]
MSSSVLNLGGMQSVSTMTGTIDYSQIIEQLTQANRAPGDALNSTIQNEQLKQNDWSNVAKLATAVQNDLVTLASAKTFSSFTTTIGGTDSSAVSASASGGATAGAYAINVTQQGSKASLTSGSEIGKAAALTDTVNSNEFSQPISLGTISATIGGTTVSHTVTGSDSIDSILTALFGANGSQVSWSMNNNQLSISNNTAQNITFGTAGDASNLFQVLGLTGQALAGTGGSVKSSLVGHAQLNSYLASANFASSLSPTTSGDLQLNGVDVKYNTSTDTFQSLINSINSSTAGVTASYDPLQDKMILTSNTSQPVSVTDVSGNLGQVLGLTSGVAGAGKPWIYQINNGPAQTSASATVASAIPGVSFTMNQTGSATLTVAQDTSALTKAVNAFVGDFNTLYGQLNTYTGKGGDLQGDVAIAQLGFQYMNDVLNTLPGMTQFAQQSVWGIGVNNGAIGSAPGTTNSLQVDSGALTTAFANDPSEVQSLLTGMATRLNTDLTNLTGQFNALTPNSLYSQNISGIAQNMENMYADNIKNTEQQQQQIYDQAAAQAQQMQTEFNQLQQFQQQMAAQQNALAAMLGSLKGY